jgi:hypothetical protein
MSGIRSNHLDSSFISFRDTVSHHLTLFFGCRRSRSQTSSWASSLRMGFDADDGDVEAAIRGLNAPMMFIAGSADRACRLLSQTNVQSCI